MRRGGGTKADACSVGVAGCHGQTMAGRGLVSGCHEVTGWSAAEVCRGACRPERPDCYKRACRLVQESGFSPDESQFWLILSGIRAVFRTNLGFGSSCPEFRLFPGRIVGFGTRLFGQPGWIKWEEKEVGRSKKRVTNQSYRLFSHPILCKACSCNGLLNVADEVFGVLNAAGETYEIRFYSGFLKLLF